MPRWKELLPQPPKEKCDHCGKEADLMDYGEGKHVCSTVCLFWLDHDHPALNGYSEDWKKRQVLIAERDRIDREIEALRSRKE